jgi:predicted ATPase
VKLLTAHITNFRSAEDSEEFTLSPITCLVGKNEAGKSAILLALAALNPHGATPATLDKERDYPRRTLTQYEERHGTDEAIAVKTTWKLEEAELNAISSEVGAGVITSDVAKIFRRYGKGVEVEVSLDYAVALENLYKRFALDASERSVLSAATNTSELITLLPKLASPSAKHTSLKEHLAKAGAVTGQVHNIIRKLLPQFMYFSSYDRMSGAIQLEETKVRIDNEEIYEEKYSGDLLFAEFLDYAGVSIDDIMSVSTYETFNAKLQAASNNITDQILEYWTQNPDLSVIVRVEQARSGDAPPLNQGTIARARVDNSLHRVDTPFSERSAGFVWFFSFLVKFAQVKDDLTPVVLLLDEPGLTLHGKAQADLLRFFKEKLGPHHQIVYSTHSPFMVPADDFTSVRVVQDQVEMRGPRRVPLGTKVRDDVLVRDPDTLFPLQGALGYEISQSLFVGKNTLLVEGPSDIVYLQVLSDALRRRKRPGLDPRWTLCPAGGIDKIRPFVSLFSGNHLNVAALADQAVGDKRKLEELRRSEILKAGQFYTFADLLDVSEADVEDIFDPELFVTILNSAYELPPKLKLTTKTLDDANASTTRLVKKAEAAFNVMPESIPIFDHFTPAGWLLRHPTALDGTNKSIEGTLDRAEKIIVTFNKLLEGT